MDRIKDQTNIHRKWRISLAILAVVICSLNIYHTTDETLRHSRDLHRALNKHILLHDDLDIYWFGYRVGQYLISYPIQQYYFVQQFGQFIKRMQQMMGNLQFYSFGFVNQSALNQTNQKIVIKNSKGGYKTFQWTIQNGIQQPFDVEDLQSVKQVLIDSDQIQISVQFIQISEDVQGLQYKLSWNIIFIIQIFSQSSIFVTIFLHDKIYLGIHHIPHIIVGVATLILVISQIRKRQKILLKVQIQEMAKKDYTVEQKQKRINRFKVNIEDMPDLLICFFLIYSSVISFTNVFTTQFIFLLDGIACFICWLYILKLYTKNDDYHISFLIRKSYILVGRLFVSFGPLFIGFCLFALAVFSRYSTLFVSFHKTLISIFCVCYYNMTYEQFRTTQRNNPLSSLFFFILVMLFTVCIYSGMLVSVFCSYMWNKREKKHKEELLQHLKIQCASCSHKYYYADGYKASIRSSAAQNVTKNLDQFENPFTLSEFRKFLRQMAQLFQNKIQMLLCQSKKQMEFLSNFQQYIIKVEKQQVRHLKVLLNRINNIKNQLSSQIE